MPPKILLPLPTLSVLPLCKVMGSISTAPDASSVAPLATVVWPVAAVATPRAVLLVTDKVPALTVVMPW